MSDQDRPMTEEEFFAIWQGITPGRLVVEHRLYYDDNGYPLFYSTEDLPGNYIVVDEETYVNSPKHIRIHDGKIITYQVVFGKKLKPSLQGRPCHPNNVCVIVDEDRPHTKWTLKHEEPSDDQTH